SMDCFQTSPSEADHVYQCSASLIAPPVDGAAAAGLATSVGAVAAGAVVGFGASAGLAGAAVGAAVGAAGAAQAASRPADANPPISPRTRRRLVRSDIPFPSLACVPGATHPLIPALVAPSIKCRCKTRKTR